ncbi:ABC transporter permease [Anaerosporobacter faecicola]|uniref:ABC transporter permease n=1 Tax=Anaerosporobacter faecicola TaxID=2718714 RepID=UPI00143AD81E|nr:ABC transporter permease [Anaerosporobacter faecicola]
MKYILKKISTLIITLFLVTIFTFTAFQVIPGDSVSSTLGMDASPEAIQALRHERGLDDPLVIRYGRWLGGVLKGDFGESTQYNMPVWNLLSTRLTVTIWLAAISIVLIFLFSFPIGILSAKKEDGFFDRLMVFLTQTFMAIPPFFLGMILTLVFGVCLKWFIPGNYVSFQEDKGKFFAYLIYPAIAMAIPKIAMTVKFLRSSIRRQMHFEYVRTAKSKGNSKRGILVKHVLKNACIPVITFLGMIIADVLAGSIIIEQVFNLPGMGRLLVVAIANRDYAVVQAVVLYIATIVVVINLLVDILYRVIDPRISKEGGAR